MTRLGEEVLIPRRLLNNLLDALTGHPLDMEDFEDAEAIARGGAPARVPDGKEGN